jgi:hypothetical protein
MGLLNETQHDYYNGSDLGNYQFVTLDDIISSFMAVYTGESKILTKVNRTDVQFHGMRAIQELSYDVLKSKKSQEIEVPPSLKMMLPQDYVNYTKLVRVGSDGIERPLYPTSRTSNPFAIDQKTDGTYDFDHDGDGNIGTVRVANSRYNDGISVEHDSNKYIVVGMPVTGIGIPTGAIVAAVTDETHFNLNVATTGGEQTGVTLILTNHSEDNLGLAVDSDTWTNYQSAQSSNYNENSSDSCYFNLDNRGRRYGLDPQHAQANGTFYIDNSRGFIHFGSNLAGETIILKYISDGLGTDAEMLVHKFAEEAVYKHIMYGLISGRSNIPEGIVQRYKKEKFAETRKAKIRLSNIKMEEFTQVLRGLSKPIK